MRNKQWVVGAVVLAVAAALIPPTPTRGQTAEEFDKLYDQCWELMAAGKYAEGERSADRLDRWARGALADQPLRLADACGTRGVLYWHQGRYAEAEPLYKQALEIRRKRLGDQHPDVAASLNNLANLYFAQGRYAEAEPLMKQAVEIYETYRKRLGKQHPRLAQGLNTLANNLEAGPLLKQVVGIVRKRLGDRHPDVAGSLNSLGALYADQGRYAEAEPLFKQALEIRRKALGDQQPDVAASLNNLANLYSDQGRYAEAEPLYKQALAIKRKVLGDQHPAVAASFHNLANLYSHQGRYAEAEPLFKQALQIRRKALGDQHPDVAGSLNNLAALYADQGRYAEAEPLVEEARKIARRGLCDPQLVARIHWRRADVYWQTGRKAEAAAALEEALAAVEQQRTQVSGGEIERARFFGGWTHLFESMVAWQSELGRPAEAFGAIERARARSLLDQMAAAGTDLLAGLPEQEAERLRRLESEAAGRVAAARKQLQTLQARRDLAPEQKEKEQQRLEAALRRAKYEYTQAYAEVRNASPAYRLAVGADQKPVAAEKLGQWVRARGALLLEYLLGDKAGYVFVLPAGGEPQLVKLELTSEQAVALGIEPEKEHDEQASSPRSRTRQSLAGQSLAAVPLTAQRMRAILTNADHTGVLDHLRASNDPRREAKAAAGLAVLWNVLIPEAQRKAITEGKYQRLVVLPDAALAQLPFETLVVEPGRTAGAGKKEPKYLLDAGPPILYAPSATILVNLAQRKAQASRTVDQPVLAVGDCLYGEPGEAPTDTLLAQLAPQARYRSLGGRPERLKYSGWELSFVAQVFGKQGIKVGWLKGPKATERNVRYNVPGHRIVDLACHGRADQRYGNLFGALALTPGPDSADAADDGMLTLAEIYELHLAGCELAILSACETNVGPEQRGEGVWALSRGFLAAGARRVAATNWLLDDEAAASTVSYFCSALAKQQASGGAVDHAEALQKAKRWVRSVKTEKHDWTAPYYWAPMVLIGPQ